MKYKVTVCGKRYHIIADSASEAIDKLVDAETRGIQYAEGRALDADDCERIIVAEASDK